MNPLLDFGALVGKPSSDDESVEEFAATLRASDPPVIGYTTDGRLKLDMRTIFPAQDDLVIKAIRAACTK